MHRWRWICVAVRSSEGTAMLLRCLAAGCVVEVQVPRLLVAKYYISCPYARQVTPPLSRFLTAAYCCGVWSGEVAG
jgi:hypothetical protein